MTILKISTIAGAQAISSPGGSGVPARVDWRQPGPRKKRSKNPWQNLEKKKLGAPKTPKSFKVSGLVGVVSHVDPFTFRNNGTPRSAPSQEGSLAGGPAG